MIRIALLAAALLANPPAHASEPPGLGAALNALSKEQKFSGAVVIRGPDGVRFARGYGLADPSTGRRFTIDTPVDGASLAKPVTAAAILLLHREGRIKLDVPVRRYVLEYPHSETTVRHLLSHSAGLPDYDAFEPITGKTTGAMLRDLGARLTPPSFAPGSAFAYCNLCYDTLAVIVERVSGLTYQQFIDRHLFGPAGVRSSKLRPLRLTDWRGRAIGHRRDASGGIKLNDSWEGEAFYGGGNIAFTAADLARWGGAWADGRYAPVRTRATQPAVIAGRKSGLTWGNWYCVKGRRRCHYLGHHEGFHNFLYWDSDRRISIAMVSNNTLDSRIHQRLQRALVAFAEGRAVIARRELDQPLASEPVKPGRYKLPNGETLNLFAEVERSMTLEFGDLHYAAFRAGPVMRYVPGLDLYLAGTSDGHLLWLSLYEDLIGQAAR